MASAARESRPNTLWPIGTQVGFLDAWGRNEVRGRIIRHYGEINVLVEAPNNVVYFGETWRIVDRSEPDTQALLAGMFD